MKLKKSRHTARSNEITRRLLAEAGLKLTVKQLDRLAPDMAALARNIARLDELDLSQIEPAVTLCRCKGER